jgi:hypothetical protein
MPHLCATWGRCGRAQAEPCAEQPALFELHYDHRPAGDRNVAERYREPSLFHAWSSSIDRRVPPLPYRSRVVGARIPACFA